MRVPVTHPVVRPMIAQTPSSPIPWYLSEIMESQLDGIKYIIRSEDRNQFPTWIAELANHGPDNGKSNGELIVKAVNNHTALIHAAKVICHAVADCMPIGDTNKLDIYYYKSKLAAIDQAAASLRRAISEATKL